MQGMFPVVPPIPSHHACTGYSPVLAVDRCCLCTTAILALAASAMTTNFSTRANRSPIDALVSARVACGFVYGMYVRISSCTTAKNETKKIKHEKSLGTATTTEAAPPGR